MKINFVSFSDFKSDIEIYDLKKMDLFVYLLIEIIKKGSEKTIKEVLLDLDISIPLLYLYQNNFYYLLDNKLIINNSNSDDISKIRVNDVAFSEFGNYCLSINCVPSFSEVIDRSVIYNVLSDKLVSENNIVNSSNIVVINKNLNYLELINKYKKEIVGRYSNDFMVNYNKLEANPFYYSVDVDINNLSEEMKRYLKLNVFKVNDNKIINEKNSEFLSSNFKIKLFYGRESNLVNSDYYLIVDNDNEFKVEGNKIYVRNIVKELSEFSFVEIDNKVIGYNTSNVKIDDVDCGVFERISVKDYTGEIKKYLSKNKEKFNDMKVVCKVIDLL